MSKIDLGGLDDFNVSDLMSQSPSTNKNIEDKIRGKIVYLSFDVLHDDPNNSRTSFDEKEIASLAESIKAISPRTGKPRGIKQPLSVRPHPDKEGEYIINGGHRRKRAGILASLTEAPCLIDADADDYDNAIDNIERVGLTAVELAAFIKRRLDLGDSKGEVARALGKPNSMISDHLVFFEMPDFIRELYDDGICNSAQGLAILHRAAKKNYESVKSFCIQQKEELYVSQIRTFVDSLKVENNVLDTLEDEQEPKQASDVLEDEQELEQANDALEDEQELEQASDVLEDEQEPKQASDELEEDGVFLNTLSTIKITSSERDVIFQVYDKVRNTLDDIAGAQFDSVIFKLKSGKKNEH